MLSIDEAIARERQQAKEQRSRIGTWDDEYSKKCEVWAEEHEQIAKWLEELKALKEYKDNSVSKEAFEKMKSKAHRHGYRQGYAKAIDEFAEEAIKIVYDSNDRDRNPQPRDMVADIHYKLMDLAKLLKEQNK